MESKHKTALAPLGQFFTPRPVAKFMANSFLEAAPQKVVRILDPGAGAGVLSCALIERIAEWAHKPRKIELVAYEIDPQLEPILRDSFQYLEHWLSTYNIVLSVTINASDFLAERQECFGSTSGETEEGFDFIIANPPYSKSSRANASTRKFSSAPVSAQPNVYASFMAVATSLLLPGGQLTFITPRSFASGLYFKAFRKQLFEQITPLSIHIFSSRDKAFKEEKVLQETVILHGRKDRGLLSSTDQVVRISSSLGLADLAAPSVMSVPITEVISAQEDYILHIPTHRAHREILRSVKAWKHTLQSFRHGCRHRTHRPLSVPRDPQRGQ